MRTHIRILEACSVGLTLIASNAGFKAEREHLKVCGVCNPELVLGQLWKGKDVHVTGELPGPEPKWDSLDA